jgi:hypothetical protein
MNIGLACNMSKLTLTICLSLFSYHCVAQQLTDPTRPATYSSPTKPVSTVETAQHNVINTDIKLILNSTIVANNHKVAIINGVQFKVGDDLNDGSIIQSITHQQVKLLQKDGEVITLSLQKSFISNMKSTASELSN